MFDRLHKANSTLLTVERRKFCTAVYIATLTLLMALSGCSHIKDAPNAKQEPPTPPEPLFVDDKPFPTDTLYALLVAEMAGDRQRFDVMLGNYVQQAELTSDPGVAARAARLARYLKVHKVALDMTNLWLERDPNNAEAHYIATAELVHANQLLPAVDHATFLLEQGDMSGFEAIAMRAQHGGDAATTQTLIDRYHALLASHPDHMPLHLGLSLLYQHSGDLNKALEYSENAMKLAPDDFQAAAQETRVLQQMGKSELALAKLGQLVDKHPENTRLRLQYARALLKTDLESAEKQFVLLREQNPDDLDITLTLALIRYELGMMDEAKQLLTQLLSSPQHASSANYYLGRIATGQDNEAKAKEHFSAVQPGPDYLPALSELIELMSADGQQQEALSYIRNQRMVQPEEVHEGLYLLEAYVLSNNEETEQATQLIASAIEQFPESTRLLYTRAMLFTELGKLDRAEQDFMTVLALSPDHAGALNAWGYTLADRSERLDEAYRYISKAYQLTPDDPAVIDSMGWVEYRMGNLDTAVEILRKAMAILPDHEIAAHLGEVLWVSGKQSEARKVWREGLKNNPDSEIILNTMIRLKAVSADEVPAQ